MTVIKNGDGTYTLTPTAIEQRVITALRLEFNSSVDPVTGEPRPNVNDARVLQAVVEGELRVQRQRLIAINDARRSAAYTAAPPANQETADTAIGFTPWI